MKKKSVLTKKEKSLVNLKNGEKKGNNEDSPLVKL